MDLPDSLAARMYLLAYNTDKGRIARARLTEHTGPVAKALRKAVQAAQSAAAS